MVKLLFCATEILLKMISAESQCLTHKMCWTDILVYSIFSNSPAKHLHMLFTSTIMGKQNGSCLRTIFQLSTWYHRKFYYLSICVTLFSIVVDCADARSIFTLTRVKLTIMTSAAAAGLLKRGSAARVIKEASRPHSKGLDILRNHSFWNVIDGGISVGGLFSFWVWYIVNVYVYFFISITIIVLFKISLIIENFFKKNIDLIDFTLSILLINK